MPSIGRLKPVNVDPLESIGLPSKGALGLRSSKAQEEYFGILSQRCRTRGIPTNHADGNDDYAESKLSTDLQNLSLQTQPLERGQPSQAGSELTIVLSAMRKLRESLISTKRCDSFAVTVYLFIIRATIPLEYHEAYHPALLYAIHTLARICKMDHEDYAELLTYEVFDLAGRQNAMNEAWQQACNSGLVYSAASSKENDHFAGLQRGHLGRLQIRAILRAAMHHNIVAFYRHYNHLPRNERILLGPLERRVAVHATACLPRVYFTAERKFVDKALNKVWANVNQRTQFSALEGTQIWQTEGDQIVFRRPRAR